MAYYGFKPYVPVAARRRAAARKIATLQKRGKTVTPVVIQGRTIATTFWGKAWCDNLESYSDFANRLPRGRTYVRNGSVVNLEIAAGRVTAMVSGSELYNVTVTIKSVPKGCWQAIRKDCAGAIDSLVELLQGRLSKGVMERLCRQDAGLFPSPGEISLDCSCPDWATMCKHVAATLYGIGARLDHEPALLFRLRDVNEMDLIATASSDASLGARASHKSKRKVIESADLSGLFGLEMAAPVGAIGREAKSRARTKAGRVSGTSKARKGRKARGTRGPPARLGQMIEEATVDAHGESEQALGWHTMLEDRVALPFETIILGAPVTVTRIDLRDDNRIVAMCKRGRQRQVVDLVDLPLPSSRPDGSEWIEAYRYWAGR